MQDAEGIALICLGCGTIHLRMIGMQPGDRVLAASEAAKSNVVPLSHLAVSSIEQYS